MNARAATLTGSHPGITSHRLWDAQTDCCARRVPGKPPAVKPSSSPWPLGRHVVGILAFIHSLIFLVLWLWICANAGAGTSATADFRADLRQSHYNPTQARDPFSRPGSTTAEAKAVPVSPLVFHLDGILYESANASAIVNGTLLSLNKTVSLSSGKEEVQVKAVEITRNRVVLEARGQRVELQINAQNPP